MNEIFTKRLRLLRLNANKKQEDMAKLLNVSAVSYGNWERGDAEPSIAKLIKLCQIFHASADWLLGLNDFNQEGRLSAIKAEAEQSAATLRRLIDEINQMEKTR